MHISEPMSIILHCRSCLVGEIIEYQVQGVTAVCVECGENTYSLKPDSVVSYSFYIDTFKYHLAHTRV